MCVCVCVYKYIYVCTYKGICFFVYLRLVITPICVNHFTS